MQVMKKILPLLLTVTIVLILSGCKKALDALIPTIPDTATPTAVGTPVGALTSKTIGNSGGSLVSADGNAELIFPAGALSNNTDISIQAITNNAPNGVANAYRFLPEGITFLQPVTLKFHYTADDLAATLGDLMGIAFQDSTGVWNRVNNLTNDTVNKIISAPIRHFTDWTPFDMLFINPPTGTLKVGQSMTLRVDIVESDDDELRQLGQDIDVSAPITIPTSTKFVWSANGVTNGNSTYGTLTASSQLGASYKAPSKVPSPNPVAVSATVDVKFKYDGKTFNKISLVSYITIIDGEKYLLEVRQTETADPFVYIDTASMMVLVSADGNVTVSDISNFSPETNPQTATVGDCTATWIPDNIGETNIVSVAGSISGSPGDPGRNLFLVFTHSGTVTPKFKQVCSGADESTQGGLDIPGFPSELVFTLTPNGGIYFLDDGQEFARLTLQE
jgi:hypothetical protein